MPCGDARCSEQPGLLTAHRFGIGDDSLERCLLNISADAIDDICPAFCNVGRHGCVRIFAQLLRDHTYSSRG